VYPLQRDRKGKVMLAMTSPAAILRAARRLIEEPERWTKGAAARDSAGKRVESGDTSAQCWCAYGAIGRATGYRVSDWDARMLLSEVVGGCISMWNDAPWRTHVEVLAAFDAAIALAKGEEK
jgi:hypothetical protein